MSLPNLLLISVKYDIFEWKYKILYEQFTSILDTDKQITMLFEVKQGGERDGVHFFKREMDSEAKIVDVTKVVWSILLDFNPHSIWI